LSSEYDIRIGLREKESLETLAVAQPRELDGQTAENYRFLKENLQLVYSN